MFAKFERFLTPTATPEHPEPPPGLLAFLWHFARQAKWLFAALFVVELLVALSDSAVPWFMGRVVTMVTKDAARPLSRRGLAVASRHGRRRADRPPGRDARALSHQQPGAGGAVHRTGALAVALARGAAELGVLPERFRRPHFQSRDADRALGALDADRDHHHGLVHYRLRRFRHRADRLGRSLARGADPAVVLRATPRCSIFSCRACASARR